MGRSSLLSNLIITISVVVVLLSLSPVVGKYCSCNAGAIVSAEASSAPAACADAASDCLQENCNDDEECEGTPKCGFEKILDRFVKSPPNATVFCQGRCTGGNEKCVKSGGGQGDPHLTGFDGSRYDFHGQHGKHYLLFGRSNGDSLVTRMRSSGEISPNTLVEKTFFDGFGLQLRNCSHRISLSLVPDNDKPDQWRSQIMLNGKEIVTSQNLGCADVNIGTPRRTVTVTSADTKYSFTPKLRSRQTTRRHIDVNVKLLRNPQKSDMYFGVLGFTMNKVVGHDIHPDLEVASRERVELENSLRNMFEVDSLFSSYMMKSNDLESTVRMVSEDNHFDIPLMLSAEVKST